MDKRTAERPGVTIRKGPADWQIIQRDREGFADIRLEGTYVTQEEEFTVQARIVLEATGEPAAYYLDWQDAQVDRSACTFQMELKRVPQGGLYRIETRVRRPKAQDKRALRGDYVHHLGVGDLYVLAGQSNASGTGKGAAADGPMLGVHVFANDEHWKLAAHPLEDATGTLHPITITGIFHGTSPWLAFGRKLYQRTGVPVGLIPTALGGSLISMWMQEDGTPGLLYENMQDMIQKAGGRFAAVLWYQGESEAFTMEPGTIGEYYRKAFSMLVSRLRELAGNPDLPIIAAQLNRYVSDTGDRNFTDMRETQRALSHELEHVYLIVTADCPLSDEIHNNSTSNVVIGERFADVALEKIFKLPVRAGFPEAVRASFLDQERNSLKVEFLGLQGDWTPMEVIRDFSVEGPDGFEKIAAVTIQPDNSVVLHLAQGMKGEAVLHGLYGTNPQVCLKDDGSRCLTPFSMGVEDREKQNDGVICEVS